MKILNLALLLILSIYCLFGCYDVTDDEGISISGNETLIESMPSKEPDESLVPPEEIFDFSKSEYTVSSKTTSFETVYEREYYFIEGAVAGAKIITTLETEAKTEEYYELMLEDYDYCTRDGLTVTYYVEDDEAYYYGYSLEKLKFVLEKSGCEVIVNFDEEEFSGEISEVSEE